MKLQKVDEWCWRLPRDGRMNTDGIVFADADLLQAIGFTPADIEAANVHCCGAMTIEGAPGLDPAHLPVFDCANACGRTGTRFQQLERTLGGRVGRACKAHQRRRQHRASHAHMKNTSTSYIACVYTAMAKPRSR